MIINIKYSLYNAEIAAGQIVKSLGALSNSIEFSNLHHLISSIEQTYFLLPSEYWFI